MRNRLHTVKQILEAGIYEIVDLKGKIITKSQSKQSAMKNQVSMQKTDRYYCSRWHGYNQTNFMGITDRLCEYSGKGYVALTTYSRVALILRTNRVMFQPIYHVSVSPTEMLMARPCH